MTIQGIELSDEMLAQRVQEGHKEDFGILMERYQAKLFRYGKKFITGHDNIEDVVQDVFIKTYQHIKSFDTSQKFSSWIYRIAHNTYVNAVKKQSREPLYLFDFDLILGHTIVENPREREQEQEEIRLLVEKGLDMLPSRYREIIVLYYMEELSYKEIADILQVPVGTVGIRLKRAKDKLKNICVALEQTHGK
ncbi:MAG: polymerase sigma-70 factor, subfamily [Patescibacteria group bacterium]|nr:polymerase sigma-70 factor, subfamily [Patescibacteria group bacterium]